MELKSNYDYCIIKGINNVILYNDNVSVTGDSMNDKFLVHVQVQKMPDGELRIQGEELNWRCATSKTPINELDEKPMDKYINHSNGCKWLGIKPYDYVLGWYITTKRKKVMYLLSDYNIKVIEE
jgi:beta-lactamase class A